MTMESRRDRAAMPDRALRLYRIREVADLLGLCQSKAYALISSGSLRAIKIDRATRVDSDEVVRFIDERRQDDLVYRFEL